MSFSYIEQARDIQENDDKMKTSKKGKDTAEIWIKGKVGNIIAGYVFIMIFLMLSIHNAI